MYYSRVGQVPKEDMMRMLVLAVLTAAPILATLPVTAHADPYGRGPFVQGDQVGMRHGDHFRHDGWERGRHFGWQRHPWWVKRHRFFHDYGWYRAPHYRSW
jgi:hypothetical protein